MKMRIREIGEMEEIYLSKWLERSIREAIDRNDFDLANGFEHPDTETMQAGSRLKLAVLCQLRH